MGCCGNQRRHFSVAAPTQRGTARPQAADFHREPKRSAYAYFQYLGGKGLTVHGPVSGQRYRFDRPGAIIAVDPRDRRSVAAVPNLRQVSSP